MSTIVMYGKPRCSLCDHAKEALVKAGIQFDEVDITSDPGLMQEFGVFIPVVEVDGKTVFEAAMDPADLPDLVRGGSSWVGGDRPRRAARSRRKRE